MGEESEKRFEAIMNKLFPSPPKSKINEFNNSRQNVPSSGDKRRRSSSSTSASVGMIITGNVVDELGSSISASDTSALASPCRPWDRVDLFKRLSTFKSMTWFAKPEAVSPVNCARRGWINVNVDTIACASCGSRLLFSTPTAWTLQQVEKAAAVFSLKLESGHKLLCPWINSICSEELAHFPTVSWADLIQDFKKRYFALSQLIALPIISPIAIDNMRNPMLDNVFREISASERHTNIEDSRTEHVEVVTNSVLSISYQQTQLLISLCGWEPHMLPYIVDFKDGKCQSIIDTSGMVANGKRQKVGAHSSSRTEDPWVSGELQFDPSSSVLNCNLCGASAGLWTFCTVPRPVEHVRLVGSTEVNGINDPALGHITYLKGSPGHAMHGDRECIKNSVPAASASSGVTIAGGPPPAMLNYNATISLPVVGKSLRARLLMETESKDQLDVKKSSKVDKGCDMSLEEVNAATDDTLGNLQDFIANNLSDNSKNVLESSGSNANVLENETMRADADQRRSFVGEYSCPTPEGNSSSKNGEAEANRENMVEAENREQNSCQINCQDNSGLGAFIKLTPFTIRESTELRSLDKTMEFDPIKQHRHFCPWILSSSKSSPGWQQTVSALHGHSEFSFSLLSNVPASPVIEVDDPVASAKKLFTSPNDKRTNVSHGS